MCQLLEPPVTAIVCTKGRGTKLRDLFSQILPEAEYIEADRTKLVHYQGTREGVLWSDTWSEELYIQVVALEDYTSQ